MRFSSEDLDWAAGIVGRWVPPTPQYVWPLLAEYAGAEVWVKHENHTPTGAFKVRGGLVYAERLRAGRPEVKGVVSATRGNHGQSLAFAGRAAGIGVTIVVPEGNSPDKNAAMQGFGAELIVHGRAAQAMRVLFSTTHNVPEPAGALALAGLLAERRRAAGKRVGVIQTGGNADTGLLLQVLAGQTPTI